MGYVVACHHIDFYTHCIWVKGKVQIIYDNQWLSTNKLKLNSDKTEFMCLAQSLSAKNLISPSRSTYLVISYHQQMQLGTLVSGLILISHSLAMLGRSARLVLLMSGILSDSEDI